MSRSCHSATFLQCGQGIRAHEAGQAAHLLAGDRVALVRHRARALLPCRDGSSTSSTSVRWSDRISVATFSSERPRSPGSSRTQRAGPAGRSGWRSGRPRDRAGGRLPLRRPGPRGRRCPRADSFPTRTASRPAGGAPSCDRLGVPERGLEAEDHGFGVDAVGAAHAQGVAMPERQRPEHRPVALEPGQQEVGGLLELQRERGVHHIRRREAHVDVPESVPSASSKSSGRRSRRGGW